MQARVCLVFAVALVLVAAVATAQEFRATITGIVTDPSGAPITDAQVVVTNIEKNTVSETITNVAGIYAVRFLQPGKYTLSVTKPGFKKFSREGIALASADRLAIDAKLELGAVIDSVTVAGDVSLLQTESASRTTLMENRLLENVPSGGRNLYALQYSQPGVVKTSNYWGAMELYAFTNAKNVSIGGGRDKENETVIDGITNTNSSRSIAFVPSLNGTQEFTLRTNAYDAQYGRVGGGVTQITVKSGTNAPHGQVFEYFKNDKLIAMNWIANKNGDPKTAFKNNTFGFELDGPLYVPKVLDGRNRAFFMISYEGLREHLEGSNVRTVPTSEQIKGDFSKLLNDDGALVSIFDPTTTQLGSDGKTYVRTAFPGNKIPSSRINPVASKVASYLPTANLPGDGPSHINNYALVRPETNTYDSWLGKLDYRFSDRSTASFRYGQTPYTAWASIWGIENNPAEPTEEGPEERVGRTWGADWTYTISPTVVFNLRGGLARYEQFTGNKYGRNFDPRQLGFPSSLVSQFSWLQFPRFDFDNYTEIGGEVVTNYEAHDTWSLQPNISLTRGRHFLKVGSEFRLYNDNTLQPGSASGVYAFTKGWTQADPKQSDNTSANDFASFLLGYPASGSVPRNIDPSYRSNYYAAFLQDDFKVNSKLTLNLGIRWDYEAPRVERHDRQLRGFAFDQASPIAGQVQALTLKGGLLYAGVNGQPRGAFDSKAKNFQPRIGVAYHLMPKLVLRGGYGLSYLGQSSNGAATGYSRTTSLVSTLDGGLTPAASLSDPFPSSIYPNGLLTPIGNSQGLATNLGQSVSFQYVNRPLPYSHQYSFGLQYELPAGWMADISYVGNQTKRLPVSLGLNFIPRSTLLAVAEDQRLTYFSTKVVNPMAGLLPDSGLNTATIPRQQLLYAFPQYSSVTATDVPIGSQRYDSLQMQFSHRFSKGLSLQVAYTIAKATEQVSVLNAQDVDLSDLLNTTLEKRLIQYDVPQQFAVIGSYDLPFGRGRHFFSNTNWLTNGVFGGWTFSGQWQSHSGYPLAFPNAAPNVNRSARLTDAQRDALAQKKGRSQYDVSYDVWFDTSVFPTKALGAYQLRAFPTRFPDVRTRPLNIADISLYKEFKVHERIKWQVRIDGHNVGNFPWFAKLASSDVTSSKFGKLTADMTNETRVVVLVMKVVF